MLNSLVTARTSTNSTYVRTDSPGKVFQHSVTSGERVLGTAVRTFSNNVDWKQKVARRQDATSDYTRIGFSFLPTFLSTSSVTDFGSVRVDADAYIFDIRGEDLFNPAIENVALREKALARCKQRLQNAVGNFKAMAPTAELKELRGLVRGAADITADLLKLLISLKKRGVGKKTLNLASQAWLNYSFAIKPLVSDIAQASEAVSKYLLRQDFNMLLHGSASTRWNSEQSLKGFTGLYNGAYDLKVEALHELSYRYACGVQLLLKSANNYGIDDHFGFKLRDLPSTAWELVPFSWVADYFGTVGNYLEDTFEMPSGSTKYLYLNKRYKIHSKVTGRNRALSAISKITYDQCYPGFLDAFVFTRTKLSSLPHASLRWKSSDEMGVNAVNRVLNLASVLVSSRTR